MSKYLMRSVLFFPAHNRRVIESALHSDADALVFDIEDSVLPNENKQIARDTVVEILKVIPKRNAYCFVRTNEIDSGLIIKDLMQLSVCGIDGFFIPKIKCKDDVIFISKFLDVIEKEKGVQHGKFKIVAVIETTAGLVNLNEICKATDRMIGLVFGCEDYIADLDGIHDREDQSIWMARATIANTAKANNIFALDAPHIYINDLDDLVRHIKIGRNFGFDGMPVLHPKQIPIVNKSYSPSTEEVAEAELLIKLNDKAILEGKGVAIKDGRFIGPPIMEKVKKILEKHLLILNKGKI